MQKFDRTLTGLERAETLRSPDALEFLRAGRKSDAEKAIVQRLQMSEAVYGQNDIRLMSMLNDVGVFYVELQQYQKAEEMFKRAVEIERRSSLDKGPNVAMVMRNYADLLRKLDRETEATVIEARAKAIEQVNTVQMQGLAVDVLSTQTIAPMRVVAMRKSFTVPASAVLLVLLLVLFCVAIFVLNLR